MLSLDVKTFIKEEIKIKAASSPSKDKLTACTKLFD